MSDNEQIEYELHEEFLVTPEHRNETEASRLVPDEPQYPESAYVPPELTRLKPQNLWVLDRYPRKWPALPAVSGDELFADSTRLAIHEDFATTKEARRDLEAARNLLLLETITLDEKREQLRYREDACIRGQYVAKLYLHHLEVLKAKAGIKKSDARTAAIAGRRNLYHFRSEMRKLRTRILNIDVHMLAKHEIMHEMDVARLSEKPFKGERDW